MVKKRLASGEACAKCAQTEKLLVDRGLWDRIDEVVWAVEGEPESPGFRLADEHQIESAPFFIVEEGGASTIYTSALKLIKERLGAAPTGRTAPAAGPARAGAAAELSGAAAELAESPPETILRWGLERYGADCVIAFSGSDDVVLIDMAASLGLPFSVLFVDTGRLPPETYAFVEEVRSRYRVDIGIAFPEPRAVEAMVREKGLFSFYEEGHEECCRLRKVEPLRRALGSYSAWVTGQRRDQSAETRAELPVIETERTFAGRDGPLAKLNPLAAWSADNVWSYIRERGVPYNSLHERGFRSIGCAPCTRAVLPGQAERDGRWWWEDSGHKECGLHAGNLGRARGA